MDAGRISFILSLEWIGGGREFQVSDEQRRRHHDDPISVVEEVLGVTMTQYLSWLDLDGYVQCSASTKHGNRCRRTVPGSRCDTPAEWSKRSGYCSTHDPR